MAEHWLCKLFNRVFYTLVSVMRTQGSLRLILNMKMWPGMTVMRASQKSIQTSLILDSCFSNAHTRQFTANIKHESVAGYDCDAS